MWGALISGGLSLASGLFGRSDAKKENAKAERNQMVLDEKNSQAVADANRINADNARWLMEQEAVQTTETSPSTTRSWVDTDAMMAAAERSGFNPQTFLMAGGLNAFLNTETSGGKIVQTSVGHNAAAAAQLAAPQIHQAGSAYQVAPEGVGRIFADAFGVGWNVYQDQKKQEADRAFQLKLIDHQLAGVAANSNRVARSFNTPSMSTTGSVTVGASLAGAGRPTPAQAGEVKFTNPWTTRNIDATSRDAEAFEQRYGDVLSNVGGFMNVMDDIVYNVTGTTNQQRGNMRREAVSSAQKFLGGLNISPTKPALTLAREILLGGRPPSGATSPTGGGGAW